MFRSDIVSLIVWSVATLEGFWIGGLLKFEPMYLNQFIIYLCTLFFYEINIKSFKSFYKTNLVALLVEEIRVGPMNPGKRVQGRGY